MRALSPLFATCVLASTAFAHVRLINPSNGAALRWSSPSNISIVIQATGSADIDGGGHVPALRAAIRAWNDATGTTALLIENTSAAQQARTDWEADSLHSMWFDESNASGYFTPGSGIVAITPVWFSGGGTITDADIIFNGSDFLFTTSQEPGQFDVGDVATHELGHLLGLDHSGWAGATLYPYVDPSIVLHRSLSQDDVCGMRDMYPDATFGRITGSVVRGDSSAIPGAYLTARDASGRPFSSALASNSATFEIDGLAAGTYTLYARPLDAPVSSGNLSSGHDVEVDFASTMLGSFVVAAGATVLAGELVADADVSLSLGRASDDFPKTCPAGDTTLLDVRGTGLVPGSTLAASDPTITIVALSWSGTQVTFTANVPSDAAPGHVDLTVVNVGGDISILPAALEIVPQAPIVTSTNVSNGSFHGGTRLVIDGSNFRSGASVVIGREIYFDGDVGGATVLDSSTIELVTRASDAGVFDVVVIDATGVEGRLSSGFTFASNPVIDTAFPTIGTALGGTRVVLRGSDFVAGTTVTIEGVVQSDIEVDSSTRLTFTSAGGATGGPYVLELEAPDGSTAQIAFSYAADPDPLLASVTPDRGAPAGGDAITVTGVDFAATTDIYFGADPDTGLGGTLAAVTFVDDTTLEVMTPAHAAGTVSLMAIDVLTGQASVLASSFTYASSGGGGGCSVAEVMPPSPPLKDLSSLAPFVLVFALLAARARTSARTT